MCSVCGCGEGETRIEGVDAKKAGHDHNHDHHHHHDHAHGHDHGHDHHHHHGHSHGADGSLRFGGAAGVSAPGQDGERLVRVEQDILAANDAIAAQNRAKLEKAGVLALNLVSSPGSGKTTLLVETLRRLEGRPVAVIEGDQESSADAKRIRETGAPALQINTGKGCHLDAAMIASAIDHMPMPEGGTLFIENVGNLVCPAGFDLGEAHKVVICSVVEGEDKPLKYPGMFAVSDLMLITKTDLVPHLDFDMDQLIANARRANPRIRVLQLSAKSGEGMEAWLQWIEAAGAMARAAA